MARLTLAISIVVLRRLRFPMANISRTAKSGNDWSAADLSAYNITVEYQNAATFFGVDSLPQPAVAGDPPEPSHC